QRLHLLEDGVQLALQVAQPVLVGRRGALALGPAGLVRDGQVGLKADLRLPRPVELDVGDYSLLAGETGGVHGDRDRLPLARLQLARGENGRRGRDTGPYRGDAYRHPGPVGQAEDALHLAAAEGLGVYGSGLEELLGPVRDLG